MSIESFEASWVSPSTSPALEVRLSLVGTAWSSPSIDVIVRGQCVVEGENLVDWAVFRVKPEKLLKSGGKVAVSTMFEPARLKAPPARCSLEVATHQASSDLTDFSKDKVAEVRRLGGWCLGAGALAKGACPAAPVEAPTDPKGLVRAFVIDWGTDARGRPSRRIDVRAHLTTNRALAHGALQFVRAKCTAGDVALPSLERNVILGPMLAGESHVASIGLAVVRPDAPEPTRCDVTLHGTMFESREVDSCFEHGVISSGACASADSKTAGDPRCAPLDAVGEDVAFACRRVLAAWYEPAALDVWVACMVKGGGKSPCAPVVADRSAELQEKRPSDEAERAVEAATKSCKNVEDTLSRSSATARDAAWRGKAKCIELLSQMTSQGRDDVLACLDDNCREGECFLSLDACADGEGLGDGP